MISEAAILAISSSVGAGLLTLLGTIIKSHFDFKRLVALREQDRLDAEALASITEKQTKSIIDKTDEILKAGEKRKAEIVKEVKGVKSVAVQSMLKNEEAIRISNGHNEKVAGAMEISQRVLQKLDGGPQQVEVVNPPEHPIPVTQNPAP